MREEKRKEANPQRWRPRNSKRKEGGGKGIFGLIKTLSRGFSRFDASNLRRCGWGGGEILSH